MKRTGSSSRGASLFSGAIQQGRDCSSSGAGRGWLSPGAGKVTPAPTAPRSSTHLLPTPSAKQDLALDTPCPMGAGLMPTAPVSPVSTQQPPGLGIAFSRLLGKRWRWALGVTLCCGLDRNGGEEEACGWVAGDSRSCLSFFSLVKTKAEVREILQGSFPGGLGLPLQMGGMKLHIPLPHPFVGVWLLMPGQWPIWCAWGADPPTPLPSAFFQQQSTIPKVPAAVLSRMAQISPGLAPGSSPSQVLLHTVGTQPGPLQVPKAEQLSPTLTCGESGAPQGAPQGMGVPAESLDQTRWEFSFWFQSWLFPLIQLSMESSFSASLPASFLSSKSRNRERQKWSKMSDCGFETPELDFAQASAFTRSNQCGCWKRGSHVVPSLVWCCTPQPCCPHNSLHTISTPRNAGNLKCQIPHVPISAYL